MDSGLFWTVPYIARKAAIQKIEHFFLEGIVFDNQTVSVLLLLRFCLAYAFLGSFGGTK